MPDTRHSPHSSSELPGNQHHRKRRSRRKTRALLRRRRLKRLGLGAIPYFLILISLSLISIGFARYIEQDSIAAVFLTRRDTRPQYDFHGEDWSIAPTTQPTEGERRTVQTPQEGRRLTVPFFYVGDQIGILKIPSVDIEVAVLHGDREAELRQGAGHYQGSLFPGQNGNILIGAHRTSFFRNFEYLEDDARIEVSTTYGRFVYEIESMFLIDGDDHSIAEPTPEERLTLYTCYPFTHFGNAPQRYVVTARLLESEVYEE